MRDNKTIEILLNVIEKIYDKNPEVPKLIDASIMEICAEEIVSPKRVFVLLFFVVTFL